MEALRIRNDGGCLRNWWLQDFCDPYFVGHLIDCRPEKIVTKVAKSPYGAMLRRSFLYIDECIKIRGG